MTPDVLSTGSYVVAVSGGVDSIVLLDVLAQRKELTLVVAHFDHGIRPDSANDALFVRDRATTYELPFVSERQELGKGASEAIARTYRYDFLRRVARQHKSQIITAHHADDVVETVAINMLRGTGWRGLAVLDSPDIVRPLLHVRKHELIEYAKHHHLSWREDSTNQETTYLRNRLRRTISDQLRDSDHRKLLALRRQQLVTKQLIQDEVNHLIDHPPYSRYFFTAINQLAASELLRALFIHETGMSPTEPQRLRALEAIKVGRPESRHDVAAGVRLLLRRTEFVVEIV